MRDSFKWPAILRCRVAHYDHLKVKLAFVSGLDLIYIHKPYPLSHTGLHSHSPQKPQPHTPTHGQKTFFNRATFSQETLVRSHQHFECQILTKNSLSAPYLLNQMMDSGQTLCIVLNNSSFPNGKHKINRPCVTELNVGYII